MKSILILAAILQISTVSAHAGAKDECEATFARRTILHSEDHILDRGWYELTTGRIGGAKLGAAFEYALNRLNGKSHVIVAGAGLAKLETDIYSQEYLIKPLADKPTITSVSASLPNLLSLSNTYHSVMSTSPLDRIHPLRKIRALEQKTQHRFRYILSEFEKVPSEELGMADVIIDAYGVLSYAKDVSEILRKYLSVLKPGGSLFLMFTADGLEIKVGDQTLTFIDWLKTIRGLTVRGTAPGGYEIKAEPNTVIPRLKIDEYNPGRGFPIRRYTQIDL